VEQVVAGGDTRCQVGGSGFATWMGLRMRRAEADAGGYGLTVLAMSTPRYGLRVCGERSWEEQQQVRKGSLPFALLRSRRWPDTFPVSQKPPRPRGQGGRSTSRDRRAPSQAPTSAELARSRREHGVERE
jgi:hypothetical protein